MENISQIKNKKTKENITWPRYPQGHSLQNEALEIFTDTFCSNSLSTC